MIAAIGLMVGMYILTRMGELLGRSDRATGTRIMAVLTILVTLLCMVPLIGGSAGTAR